MVAVGLTKEGLDRVFDIFIQVSETGKKKVSLKDKVILVTFYSVITYTKFTAVVDNTELEAIEYALGLAREVLEHNGYDTKKIDQTVIKEMRNG